MGIPTHAVKSVLSSSMSAESKGSSEQLLNAQKVRGMVIPKGKNIRHSFPSAGQFHMEEPDAKKFKSNGDGLVSAFAKAEAKARIQRSDGNGNQHSISSNSTPGALFSSDLLRKVQANNEHRQLVGAGASPNGIRKLLNLSGGQKSQEITASSEYFNGKKSPTGQASQFKTVSSQKGVILSGGAYEGCSRTMGTVAKKRTPTQMSNAHINSTEQSQVSQK